MLRGSWEPLMNATVLLSFSVDAFLRSQLIFFPPIFFWHLLLIQLMDVIYLKQMFSQWNTE